MNRNASNGTEDGRDGSVDRNSVGVCGKQGAMPRIQATRPADTDLGQVGGCAKNKKKYQVIVSVTGNSVFSLNDTAFKKNVLFTERRKVV